MKLAVLFGGISSEHDISCLSAASILRNLNKDKYEIYPVGITRDGEWFYCPDCIEVNLPDKDIQDKMVGILSLIDEKIDINNNVNDNLSYQSLMVA